MDCEVFLSQLRMEGAGGNRFLRREQIMKALEQRDQW